MNKIKTFLFLLFWCCYFVSGTNLIYTGQIHPLWVLGIGIWLGFVTRASFPKYETGYIEIKRKKSRWDTNDPFSEN